MIRESHAGDGTSPQPSPRIMLPYRLYLEPKSQKTFNHLTHALTYLFLTLPRFHQHLSFPKLFPSFDSIPSCRKKYSGSETDTLTLTQKHAHILCETDQSFLLQTQTLSKSYTLLLPSFHQSQLLTCQNDQLSSYPTQMSPPDEENILARYHILDTSSTDGERIQKYFSTKSVISESGSYLLIDLVLVSF